MISRPTARCAALLITSTALGCGGDLPPPPGPPEGIPVTALGVEPELLELRTGPGGADPVQYSATATLEDGSERIVDVVAWSLSNQSVGTLDEGGLFTPSDTNGGETWITARLDGLEARASLTLVYEDAIQLDDAVDPAAFEGDTEALDGAWLYPADGVNIPRNTPGLRFQWRDDLDIVAWRLRLSSTYTDLSVYTRESSWEADEDTWQRVVATNAGGQVSAILTGLTAEGALLEAPPLQIHVNRLDARGSILYWSSSVEGFKRIPYGQPAEDYLTSEETGACMGCHAVGGETMAFTFDLFDGSMGAVDLESGELIEPPEDFFFGNFKSFSPDGELLLTTYRGALLLYDGQSLDYRWEVPMDFSVTQVDWAPDGLRVAMVSAGELNTDGQFTGGRIYVMDHLGWGQFGEPRLLFAPEPGGNAYYPAWSPDSQWIAFNTSTGDGYDDPDARVMVVAAEPGAEPIELGAANAEGELTNSWPRWGPLPDDDILWLTFASRRAYGSVTEGIPQIWVAAFDPARAEEGEDPSYAAFWLPGQTADENNHLPIWTD